MSLDPRATLTALTEAFERHLEAVSQRKGEGDPLVLAAYRDLAEAFEDYDDSLLDAYDEVTPLEVFQSDEEFDDEDSEEFAAETTAADAYTGLDDAEVEVVPPTN